MIGKQEMFMVICDECHKAFVNADGEPHFASAEEAEEEACFVECTKKDGSGELDPDYNFVKDGDKHYCAECAKKLGLVDDGEEEGE